jgi:hypothetical protein
MRRVELDQFPIERQDGWTKTNITLVEIVVCERCGQLVLRSMASSLSATVS